MDLAGALSRRAAARAVGDAVAAVAAEREIAMAGFDVVDGPQGPMLLPRQPVVVAAASGRGRGRGRGADAAAPAGRGRGRGQMAPASAPPAAAAAAAAAAALPPPPSHAPPPFAHADVVFDDGADDDVDDLAAALADEIGLGDDSALPPPPDWGSSTGDRPDAFEAAGRPSEHRYVGADELWQVPTDGQTAARRDAVLEQRLFATGQGAQGINFDRYADIPVMVTGNDVPPPVARFDEMPLGDVLQLNIQLAKYTTPTPVQKQAIPIVLQGRDIMACAQTGSGKTAAFILPTVSGLLRDPAAFKQQARASDGQRPKVYPKIVVLAPTRELASQIYDDACKFAYRTAVRPVVVYGGADMNYQIQKVKAGCELLVATPGRLIDFMERYIVAMSDVRYLILDEADRMLDMGFEPQIRRIVGQSDMPPSSQRQTLMFSATFPYEIQRLARDFLRPDYLFLTVGRVGAASENITQQMLFVEDNEKTTVLMDILRGLQFPPSRVLVFVNMKRTADILENKLRSNNQFPASAIHGDMAQWEREMSLSAFKDGTRPILVATDVAARGLDIPHVSHVINYDMSQHIDDYVHRIGRTGRAGHTGKAITFFNRSNGPVSRDLVRILQENNQDVPTWLAPLQFARREGGHDHRPRQDTYGGRDVRFAETGSVPLQPKEGMNLARWDEVLKQKQTEPAKKVFKSVVVVDTRSKPEWMEEDDDEMAWGNDKLPAAMPRSSTSDDGGGSSGGVRRPASRPKAGLGSRRY